MTYDQFEDENPGWCADDCSICKRRKCPSEFINEAECTECGEIVPVEDASQINLETFICDECRKIHQSNE